MNADLYKKLQNEKFSFFFFCTLSLYHIWDIISQMGYNIPFGWLVPASLYVNDSSCHCKKKSISLGTLMCCQSGKTRVFFNGSNGNSLNIYTDKNNELMPTHLYKVY